MVATFYPFINVIMNYSGSIIGVIISFIVPIVIWFCKKYKSKNDYNDINLKIYYESLHKSQMYKNFVKSMHDSSVKNKGWKHFIALLNLVVLVFVVTAAGYNI